MGTSEMKKIIVLTIIAVMSMLLMCGCFGLFQGANNTAADDLYKDTPEEAIKQYMENEELDPSKPHSQIIVDKYIFMLYSDVIHGGYYDEEKGYKMSLPWGTKIQSYIPDEPKALIYYAGITKSGNDYQIELHGYKEVNGISTIAENSPIKVYDSNGQELEKAV